MTKVSNNSSIFKFLPAKKPSQREWIIFVYVFLNFYTQYRGPVGRSHAKGYWGKWTWKSRGFEINGNLHIQGSKEKNKVDYFSPDDPFSIRDLSNQLLLQKFNLVGLKPHLFQNRGLFLLLTILACAASQDSNTKTLKTSILKTLKYDAVDWDADERSD